MGLQYVASTPPSPAYHQMYATMGFYIVPFLLFIASIPKLLSKFCVLEATERSGVALILDGGNVRFLDIVANILHGGIKARLSREVDTGISVPSNTYRLSNAPHPPLGQDWGEIARAAASSTKEVIQSVEDSNDPDKVINLYLFIQCVTLLTFPHLFFLPPTVPTNVQEVARVIGKSWKAGGRQQDLIEDSAELRRLINSSPNPSGIFILLSAMQRLILSAVCLLEHEKGTIEFLRQARVLLKNPAPPGSEASHFVEEIIRSHPPVQSIHGKLSLGWLPLRWTYDVDFLIPVDVVPQSTCLMGPDGACASCLHKAALPGPPVCSGREWLVHAAAIILSAIQTEIRSARLIVDSGDRRDLEAWEDWVLQRLRVGG